MADFNYKLEDLIDVGSVSQMFKLLYEVANIPNALIDMNGNILAGAGWQSICTDFHRKNPTSEAVCIESDIHIRNEIAAGQPHCVYECPLGLVDSSCPVIIGGHHIGNIFTGQMLHTPLTDDVRDRFRAQAKQYGYDEKAYLEALEQVPVFPIEKHTAILKLLANIAEQLGASGLTKLKTIEQGKKLQESEQYFKAISTQSSEGISVTDMDGNYTFVNPAFCEMVGWSEAELLKMQAPDFASQDQEPNTFKRSISVDEGVPLTVKLMRKDGSEFLAEVTGKVLSIDDKKRALGTVRDITKRNEDELLLRASEAKLSTIIQTSIEGYWLVDLEGRFVDVNDAYLKMSGYHKAELLGMRISDIESLETPEETAKHLEAVALAGSARFESIHHRKDGSAFSVDVSVQFQAFEGGRFVVFVRDITERKQAEKFLVQAKGSLEQAQSSANIGSWEMDAITKKLTWSKQMFQILEVNPDEEPSFDLYYSRIHPDDLAYVQEVGARVYADNEAAKAEYRLQMPSGSIKHIATEGYREFEGDEVVKLTGIVQDITERKQAEDELLKKMDEMQRYHDLIVDREFAMIELKKEVNELLKKSGADEKYTIVG